MTFSPGSGGSNRDKLKDTLFLWVHSYIVPPKEVEPDDYHMIYLTVEVAAPKLKSGRCELALCSLGLPLPPAYLQSQAKGLQRCVSSGKCLVTGQPYAYLAFLLQLIPIPILGFPSGPLSQGTACGGQLKASGSYR